MNNFPMTVQGAEALREELNELKTVKRPRIVSDIALGNAQIIDIVKIANTGKVIFGVTVTLLNIDTDEEVTYQIVGDDEADIKNNRISVNSPIARGLIGKEVDSEIEITTPGGVVEYEIVAVEHK